MKKMSLALFVVVLLALSGAAHAAVVGHVGEQVVINHDHVDLDKVSQTDESVVISIGGGTYDIVRIVPSQAQTVTPEVVKAELPADLFADSTEVFVKSMPVLTGGQHGHNVLTINHEELADFTPENVQLFLRRHDGGEAVNFPYAFQNREARGLLKEGDIGAGEYAFVDDNGGNPSPIATADSKHLVLNLVDQADYDHNRVEGVVDAHPHFAEGKKSSGDDNTTSGGGGGCDTGMAGLALLFVIGVGSIKIFGKN